MEVVKIIVTVLEVIASILLVAVILMQSGKQSGLSGALAGNSDSPKLSNIVAICAALECSVDYILTGIPENTNNYTLTEKEIDMIEDYRKLDAHSRELVSMVISTLSTPKPSSGLTSALLQAITASTKPKAIAIFFITHLLTLQPWLRRSHSCSPPDRR